MPTPVAALSLKGRALRLLAAREHSRVELARRLAPHVGEGDDLNAVLDTLQARGLLSDERAADALVHRRAPRVGTARVVAELRARGVEAGVVADAAQALRASEHERALAVWQKKFGEPATDAAARARQQRFLAARGFSPEVIRRVLRPGAGDDE